MKKEINPIHIVFEGLDCCYKETNSKALKAYFKNKGYYVILKHFPRYESAGGVFAKKYLEGRYNIENKKITKESLLNELQLIGSFYMTDMFDWYNVFYSTFNQFDKYKLIFIFDRWYYSMMYYLTKNINKYSNSADIEEYINYINYSANNIYHLPKADLLIKMVNNDIETIESISKKRKAPQDIYERDKRYLTLVKNNYNSINFNKYTSDAFKTPKEDNSVLTVNVAKKSRDDIIREIIGSKEVQQIERMLE